MTGEAVAPTGAAAPGDGRGSIARVVAVFGRQRWWIVAAALLSFVTLGAGIGLISMSGYLISRSALVATTESLTLVIVGVRAFAVLRAVGRYLERYIGHLGTFRILTRVRVWFFRGIEPLAPAALADERAGDVLTRIVDDVDALQDLSLRVLAPPAAAVLAGITGAVILGFLDPVLSVVLVVFLLVTGIVLPLATRHLSRAAAAATTAEQAVLNATTVEAVAALADLVAYGREDLLGGRLEQATVRRRRAERTLANARGLSSALAGILAGLAALAGLAIGVGLVADGRLDGVLLAVVPLATIATFEAVAPLAIASEHLDRSRAASDRLFALVDQAPTVTDPEPSTASTVDVPVELGAGGVVAFDHVTFRYRPDDPDVLRDATFEIPGGAWAGIVGPSGAGKSTIPSLLLRFWEQQAGAIRLDGTDLRQIPAETTRRHIAVVAQHDHLFDTTVRDNLRLGDADADDERLWAACRAAALDTVIEALPDGLEARAGEDGRRFSGGERQRLMIARALLAESSVLVLDEATAHLDAETERQVLDGVRRWRAGRTTIVIAHHVESLADVDLVLAVDDGQVTVSA